MGEIRWYALRTAGTKEKKAAEFLAKELIREGLMKEEEIKDNILVPTKAEIVTKNGKRKVAEKLLFPGYVLIHSELSPRLENIVRNLVPNMSGFLTENKDNGKGQKEKVPVPLRDEEVQRIIGTHDENIEAGAQAAVNFEVGEAVSITDGPFSGFSGTIEEILEDRSKVKVIVTIFGRKTQLELNFTQVTKE